MTHIGAPIVVSLANEAVSFGCKISYPHSPELKDFTAWYFHVDLQSQRSSEKQINCSAHPVQESQIHSLKCWVTPQLPNASATGTYYCSVHWPNLIRISKGIFILVRGEAPSRALPRAKGPESSHCRVWGPGPKAGNTSSIGFGKTEQGVLGEPLAAQACRRPPRFGKDRGLGWSYASGHPTGTREKPLGPGSRCPSGTTWGGGRGAGHKLGCRTCVSVAARD